MDKWVEEVLRPFFARKRIGELQFVPGLLLVDNFSVHRTSSTVGAVSDCGIRILPLPANTTHVTQPLDVGLNKPFKDRIRDKYALWMGNEDRLPVDQREIVDRRSLAAWIVEVWNDMQGSIDLKKTLVHIGYIAQ